MSFHRLTVSVPRQALPSLSSSLSALTSLGGFTLLPPETSGDSSSVGFASSAQSLVLKFVPSDEFGASGPVRIERGGFMDEGLREVLSVAPKGAEESRLKEVVVPISAPAPPPSTLFSRLFSLVGGGDIPSPKNLKAPSTLSNVKDHCSYLSHGRYLLPTSRTQPGSDNSNASTNDLLIRPIPRSSLDYFGTPPVTLTLHCDRSSIEAAVEREAARKISSTSYILPAIADGVEVRLCSSLKPVLMFNTVDVLASSVEEMQNVNVLGDRNGTVDDRNLNGDCWSEFREGYVKSGVRRTLERVIEGSKVNVLKVERGEISIRE